MKFLYTIFLDTVYYVLDAISLHIEKYSINWIRNCFYSCRFFRCTISTDCNFSCETSKSWLYQWMFWDWMCWSEVCISDMLDFYDRLYYRYTNPVLGQFCSIFCFCCINQKWCIFIQCWSFSGSISTRSKWMRGPVSGSLNEEKLYEMQNTWFLIVCID